MRKAVVFAESMLRQDWQQFEKDKNRITFGEFAKDFYTEADPHNFRKSKEAKNRKFEDTFYSDHQGRLDNYLMPKFGGYLLLSLNQKMIEEWFVSLKGRNGKDLSASTRNKILYCLRYILQTAVLEGSSAQTQQKTSSRLPRMILRTVTLLRLMSFTHSSLPIMLSLLKHGED